VKSDLLCLALTHLGTDMATLTLKIAGQFHSFTHDTNGGETFVVFAN
jgi:hypothetical protein